MPAADGQNKKDQNNASSDTIWKIITTLINASITLSTPLKRWLKVESIMFEKEKGNKKINRLRIIDKYEADYNLLLKIYWPKITNNIAEKNNTLGKNQLGTRKRKSSTDATMINEFILDTARIHQQIIAIQQNDASACYDRIIANHASINSRREGTPKRVCKLRANTLHSTKFHIQTSLGTSKESYSHQ